ncbi:rCG39012 [Rattus norvegicus]|uniref:RCG39012 n=1 Tax=Rattus norvegicus TaxID=10116 RepID=A6JXX8_RAT|nr:rCG39012 [Rattus norvegicus]
MCSLISDCLLYLDNAFHPIHPPAGGGPSLSSWSGFQEQRKMGALKPSSASLRRPS